MSDEKLTEPLASTDPGFVLRLLRQYGCGPVRFAGTDNALYERHLVFDNVVNPEAAGQRERFEAVARSVRDVLSQRWLHTENTYMRKNPKRIYYLSMEFLIGRSLSNNITNLLLAPLVDEIVERKNVDWLDLLEQEPDAGLGNGGLGRLAACFLDSMATMQLPAMGYGLRYEYGIFKQAIKDGWQLEQPDNWLRHSDPWEVARPYEKVEVKLHCSFELRGGGLRAVPGRPVSLIGIPFDRPVVGYGGKSINTLRLWAAAAPDSFDFQEFSSGDIVSAVAESLGAESLTPVLYPDDSTSMGQGLRFLQEYFLVACSLADLIRRFRRLNADWSALPEKVAIQLNVTHPTLAVPELMRILLDEAQLGWDQAWDLTRKTLAYTNHTLLPEALERWPMVWFKHMLPRHLEIILEINRCLLDEVRDRFPGDEGRIERVSLVEETPQRKVRMANLAIVGSHSTNGVAAIHSRLLRTMTVSDVSNQISTAGYEASGTSNMKFMINGALTIGTRDGATIEMAEEAGEENFFLFGLTAQQVADSRGWYSPYWHYDNEPETRAAPDLVRSDHFSRHEPGVFAPLLDTLLAQGDYYMHLADLRSYLEMDRRLCGLYADPDGWARRGILNVASSGRFSSDRTIAEYAADIWNAGPCPVE